MQRCVYLYTYYSNRLYLHGYYSSFIYYFNNLFSLIVSGFQSSHLTLPFFIWSNHLPLPLIIFYLSLINHQARPIADQIIKRRPLRSSNHANQIIKSLVGFRLDGWWFGLTGFRVGWVMNGFGIEWIWDWLGFRLSGLVFLDDVGWVVMTVAGCGGIVGSDGSVREKGDKGENNKNL